MEEKSNLDFFNQIKKNSLHTILNALTMRKLTKLKEIKNRSIFKIYLAKRKRYNK